MSDDPPRQPQAIRRYREPPSGQAHRDHQNHLLWIIVILLFVHALYAVALVAWAQRTRVLMLPDDPAPLLQRPTAFNSPATGALVNPPAGAARHSGFMVSLDKGSGVLAPNLPAGGSRMSPHADT